MATFWLMLMILGYCPSFSLGHSTTALVRVIEDFKSSMTVLVLLDFSKAFDCVHICVWLWIRVVPDSPPRTLFSGVL
jgi:hypothetical protein